MIRVIYHTGLYLYSIVIFVLSLFGHSKARAWVQGRKGLALKLESHSFARGRRYWVHCASLGEFEQGRPLIERIKKEDASAVIILSFFSPSGYEQRKNYDLADYVTYLPLDTPSAARQFVKAIAPDVAIFVKYEFWPNYFREIKEIGARLFLISVVFRPSQLFFKPYGAIFKRALLRADEVFVQDAASVLLAKELGLKKYCLSGDTRFDRVSQKDGAGRKFPLLDVFCHGYDVLIAGSSWSEEEEILSGMDWPSRGFKLMVVPHDISAGHLAEIKARFPGSLFYSALTTENANVASVLIIDNIGMLADLYAYASLAVVGGAYRGGLHNVLEAAAKGVPVCFGPKHSKFWEASALIKCGGGFELGNQRMARQELLRLMADKALRQSAGDASLSFVQSSRGATDIIWRKISQDLL